MDDVALWLAIGAITLSLLTLACVLALARELGVLLSRIGPNRPLTTTEGLDLGATIPDLDLVDIFGQKRQIAPGGRKTLLMFMAPSCPACEALKPGLATFARSYRKEIRVIVLSRVGANDKDRRWAESVKHVGVAVVPAEALYAKLRVLGTPFAMLLDEQNKVLARGAPNTLEQLEGLLSLRVFGDHDGTGLLAGIGGAHAQS